MHLDLFCTSLTGFFGQQVKGFSMYRRSLRRELGLTTATHGFGSLEELRAGMSASRASACVVMPHFRERAEDLAAVFQSVRRDNPRARIVFLDSYDQTSSPHFLVLPHVDLYVKSKLLRDRAAYQKEYLGGYVFSDFYARRYGYDLGDWHFGSRPDPSLMERVVPGWNFGVTNSCRYMTRLCRSVPWAWGHRKYDLDLRIGLGAGPDAPRDWYLDYRQRATEVAAPLRKRFRTTPEGLLPRPAFLRELWQSRIVFSPFGWGEVCMRDYEAVACGALLLKPCMDHVSTTPDIFVRDRTYVAVRWDLEDLVDRVDHYLAHPDEAEAIAREGLRVLHEYFEHGGFLADVARTLVAPLRERSG